MALNKKLESQNNEDLANGREDHHFHMLSADEVLRLLDSNKEGLSSNEVRVRQEQYGKNKLPEQKSPSPLVIFIRQFRSPLIYILLVAGFISVLIGEVADSVFIFGVVLLNAVIGALQEYKSEKSAEALQQYLKSPATVLRDGEQQIISSEDVVPGDIILLESGGRITADLRLFQTRNLTIDESLLTGESTGVEKNPAVMNQERVDMGDLKNLAFAGSVVLSGRGQGIVLRIGVNTALGKISHEVLEAEGTKSPLAQRMERFVSYLSYIIIGSVLLLAPITYLRGMPLIEIFFFSVALVVAAIPEGLPVAITIALAIRVNRMAKRHVIVRQLAAVEGLGSCTYIATDKTGTLTVNKQTVRKLLLLTDDQYEEVLVTGEGYNDEGSLETLGSQKLTDPSEKIVKELAIAGILSNEGLLKAEGGKWRAEGDPMDIALLAFGYKVGLTPQDVRKSVEINGTIPYESERQFAATFYLNSERQQMIAIKGATERILGYCGSALTKQGIRPCLVDKILGMEKDLSADGYRVLSVARGIRELPLAKDEEPTEEMIEELTFLGLVGFIDPLRPEVKDAIAIARKAGVVVGMVTGDHPKTAFAIGKELGIASTEDDVVTGGELRDLFSDDKVGFAEKLRKATIFARVTPLQKVQIVEGLTGSGHFVAVTGDGVNDAPALRKANIGVAMGSGTDVTKDTSSIIITDDNFASIVAGIEEGRFAYQNLRQVIYFLIATGAALIILFVPVLAMQLPLPLVAVQLLWLNLVSNGIQDVALAFESGESGVMDRMPRPPEEGIFNRLMIQQTIVTGATMAIVAFGLWWGLMKIKVDVADARNYLLMLMVFFGNFHALNCRSEHRSVFHVPLKDNPLLIAGVSLALALHFASMYIPFMQRVLRIKPISFEQLMVLVLLASSVFFTSEIFKYYKRRSEVKRTKTQR